MLEVLEVFCVSRSLQLVCSLVVQIGNLCREDASGKGEPDDAYNANCEISSDIRIKEAELLMQLCFCFS